MPQSMLFVRDFRHMTGGHLKFSHYLDYAAASGLVRPWLYLSEGSADPQGLFAAAGVRRVRRPVDADSYFVAGLDWGVLDWAGVETRGKPVINLVQHVRHANPDDPRYPYLSRPALRICPSQEVADALRVTGRVNGEIVVIPYGIDVLDAERPAIRPQPGRVFIGGLKNPAVAELVARHLQPPLRVDLCNEQTPRGAYLERLAGAALCVLLPTPTEGYFLPAIEAMVLGVPVVTVDCVGNRSFCRHEQSCLIADYDVDSLVAAALRLADDAALSERLRRGGHDMAQGQGRSQERQSFLSCLARVVETPFAPL
ncbi:glycosyltransferase [Magnetospirillum sp. 64-120]|uniref:glycosyltransferase n=1 Tax=Magnetospirillum sp. 64-120 TaxID=1895778 RepID=UPI00092B245D|nr:glycosyltransferase [Magnetospirillum sp. 64-120]OJX75883.1 MAG: hypothetical protein BGO92_15040 [Magnetospirillum sp. 64-120]